MTADPDDTKSLNSNKPETSSTAKISISLPDESKYIQNPVPADLFGLFPFPIYGAAIKFWKLDYVFR